MWNWYPLLTSNYLIIISELQSQLASHNTLDGMKLSLRIGIAAGDLASLLVGGVESSWEWIVTGITLKYVFINFMLLILTIDNL
jgi:hypothetical protein